VNAIALNSDLSKVQSTFRVNQNRSGDQERPQVALLKDGGAVFVWQAGRQGFQGISARFLSSSNSWLTGDILVSGSSGRSRLSPAIAVLANGNVVIVWSSLNQQGAASMQDVYAQVFSPVGQKLGSEFLVNQFTAFNQRTPAIAALSSGGFVVVWVSEQQRSGNVDTVFLGSNANTNGDRGVVQSAANIPSVDIFGRQFDGNGTPTGDEFLINTDNPICANPSVSAAADGGFVAAWGQKDLQTPSNSWDIFARSFSSDNAGGTVRRINSHLYGDQFLPHISSAGSDSLVVWTSLAQDGSAEGVYGQFLQADGSLSGAEFRVNTTTLSKQIHPSISSDSAGRFLVVWSSFVNATMGFDLYAQRFASSSYVAGPVTTTYGSPVAWPDTNSVPPTDPGNTNGGGGSAVLATLDFPASAPDSENLPNGFSLAKGSYHGLFSDANGVGAASSGYFIATTTDRGAVTAKLLMGGRTYSFSGQFDNQGHLSRSLPRAGLRTLDIQLTLSLSGGDQIRGTISDGRWSAAMLANRQVFGKGGSQAPQAGNYTVIIPGNLQNNSSPGGHGMGTVKIDATGKVVLSGTLADGSKVTQSSILSKQGYWPLYSSLYAGGGVVASWVQFTNQAESDFGGQFVWVKNAGTISKYYPRGFTNEVWAMGSAYQSQSAAVALSSAAQQSGVVLSGGGLQEAITNSITLAANNHLILPAGGKFTLKLTPATGLFKGSALNPGTGRMVTFQGVLFKKADIGVGYFLGTDQSGEVFWTNAP
jgi:hypothetical protein